jgi:hypothetical protein
VLSVRSAVARWDRGVSFGMKVPPLIGMLRGFSHSLRLDIRDERLPIIPPELPKK